VSRSSLVLLILILPALSAFIGFLNGERHEKLRNTIHMATYLTVFAIVTSLFRSVSLEPIEVFVPNLMGTGLLLRLDMLRYIFLWLAVLIWPLAMIFSTQYLIRHKNRNRYYAFYMLTYFSTIGMFLSENILNLFTFFELMSITSYFLIIHDEDDYAHRAGATYIAMAIAGGLLLLLGILLAFNFADTLVISQMNLSQASEPTRIAIGALILIGFGIKASLFPLHVWLPKAYTAAPMPATIILSAVLAKTGIFGMMLTLHYLLDGEAVLTYAVLILGMMTILVGGVLAMYQRNVKRILAYSSMSQMGYILMGIALIEILGTHGGIAVYGTLFHVVNHGIFKTLLFIGAGLIYIALHELSINVIYGFGRLKHFLKGLFLFGALAVAGLPGLNGYASKTMIHEALLEAAVENPGALFKILDILFYFGSAMTVAYMAKFFVAVFIEKNDDYYGQHRHLIKLPVLLPMSILSAAILLLGLKPELVYGPLSQAAEILGATGEVHPHLFSTVALRASAVIFILGFTLYVTFVRFNLRRFVDGRWIYVNPSIEFFNIEDDLMIPLFLWIYKALSFFFRFFDEWLIRAAALVVRMGRSLSQMNPKKIIENRSSEVIEASTHWIEAAEKASAGGYAEKLVQQGDAALEKLSSEELTQSLLKTGTDLKNNLSEKSANIGREIKSEGEMTIRKAFSTANRSMSTVTYSIFLFGAILVISFLFIFLNSTLVKY
jgi:hydrogenase-4 component B